MNREHQREDRSLYPDAVALYEVLGTEGVAGSSRRCDFCGDGPPVSYVLTWPEHDRVRQPAYESESLTRWVCCSPCEDLIRRRRWCEITQRALHQSGDGDHRSRIVDPIAVEAVRWLHRTVAENLVGEPTRLLG